GKGLTARSKAISHGDEQAEMLLKRLLKEAGKAENDLKESRKQALWKVSIAAQIKQQTAVTNRWLSERLHMGSIGGVSQAIRKYQQEGMAFDIYFKCEA